MRNLLAALCLVLAAGGPALAELRLLAFGDSLTQGYGLPPEEGFVAQLEDWLAENGHDDVSVINGGVSGDTTSGGLNRIEWALGEPVDAVIVALGGNDLLRGLDPAMSRANLDGILSAIAARDLPTLLAGLPAPANYGAAFQRDFKAMYGELAEEYGAIHVPSFLGGMTEGGDMARALAMMQDDGIHPNAAGVRVNIEAMGPELHALVAAARARARR